MIGIWKHSWLKAIGVIILSVFAVSFSPCAAQPRLKQAQLWFGAHGGVTASTVIFRPQEDGMSPITQACVLGGNGGFVFRYAGHKYCHFQMELNYEHRGYRQSGTAYNLHYIELPIMMHLNFGSDFCRWFWNLGPQIGYCVADEKHLITHPFNWGLMTGTGIYFQTRNAGVYQLEIRFDFSLGGIYGTSVMDKHSMANPMDLSINLGYLIPYRR